MNGLRARPQQGGHRAGRWASWREGRFRRGLLGTTDVMPGGASERLLASILPWWEIPPSAFVLMGRGGSFAGVSRAPLTSIPMVCEIPGLSRPPVPPARVCGRHRALSPPREQVPGPIDSGARQGDLILDALDPMHARDLPIRTTMIETCPDSAPVSEVRRRVAASSAEGEALHQRRERPLRTITAGVSP